MQGQTGRKKAPTIHKAVGRNLKRLRERAGLTQVQLAERTKDYVGGEGWSKQVISFIERGERQLDAEDLLIVAAALGAPAWQLLVPNTVPGEEIRLPNRERIDQGDWLRWAVGMGEALPANELIASKFEALASLLASTQAALAEVAQSVRVETTRDETVYRTTGMDVGEEEIESEEGVQR
jgi:transcriptional regulator with XRE-family HTH domain